MSSCLDFAEEKTDLQAKAEEMGAKYGLTPRFHCELDGEGNEYAWGVAKARYCAAHMNEKRTLDAFSYLVRRCLSRNNDSGLLVR